jgi:hypothetical protein
MSICKATQSGCKSKAHLMPQTTISHPSLVATANYEMIDALKKYFKIANT